MPRLWGGPGQLSQSKPGGVHSPKRLVNAVMPVERRDHFEPIQQRLHRGCRVPIGGGAGNLGECHQREIGSIGRCFEVIDPSTRLPHPGAGERVEIGAAILIRRFVRHAVCRPLPWFPVGNASLVTW